MTAFIFKYENRTIDKLSNKRVVIGIFPWKLIEGESCISRVVAFDGFDDV